MIVQACEGEKEGGATSTTLHSYKQLQLHDVRNLTSGNPSRNDPDDIIRLFS